MRTHRGAKQMVGRMMPDLEERHQSVPDHWLDPENERTARGAHAPVVYYMRMDRLVKIGTTVNIAGRVATIMPQGVVAIEYGSYDVEKERHRQFASDHSHGEWYWIRDALWDHISALRDRFPDVSGRTVEEWLDLHQARSTALLDLQD